MTTIFNSGESDIACPPKDVYILRFTNAGDIEMRPAYGENRDDPNCKKQPAIELTFKIVEYTADEDEDEQDWTGFEIRNLFNIGKDFNHPKSKIGTLLKALMQVEYIDVGEDIDLADLYGKRIKATVGPNDNGYPRIESPLPYKKKPAKPKLAEPVSDEDDDGAALFGEDVA